MNKVTVYVRDAPKCVKLLKYIDGHINEINDAGNVIAIKVANAATIERLSAGGVVGLPALLSGNGAVVGAEKIIAMITKPPQKLGGARDAPPRLAGTSDAPEVEDFLAAEIARDMRVENGKIAFEGDDAMDADVGDFNQRIAQFKAKSTANKPEPPRRTEQPAAPQDGPQELPDNIVVGHKEPKGAKKQAPMGDEQMEDLMLKAWMENNVS